MTPDTPACAVVLLADDIAALCTIDRIQPAPWLTNLPVRHPDRILVETKCLVARAYLVGDVDGPYDDRECETAARLLINQELLPPAPALQRPGAHDWSRDGSRRGGHEPSPRRRPGRHGPPRPRRT